MPAPGSRRRKLALLLACLLVEGMFCLLLFHNGTPRVVPPREADYGVVEWTPRANETGHSAMQQADPDAGYRPIFYVSWKNMRSENGRVGIFRTPLHRTAIFENLTIRLYDYSHAREAGGTGIPTSSPVDSASLGSVNDVMVPGAENHGETNAVATASASAVDGRMKPVYRFWSPVLSDRFYTVDESERDGLLSDYPKVWTYEGIAFHAYPAGSQPEYAMPVYRFWSGVQNRHFYTGSEVDKSELIKRHSDVWAFEGIAWYAMPSTSIDARDSLAIENMLQGLDAAAGGSAASQEPEGMAGLMQLVGSLRHQWTELSGGMKIEGPFCDLTHTTTVLVKDLHYSLFGDGRLTFSIRCRSATASTAGTEVVLRGGVTIEAAGTRKLVSNYVLWDVQENTFSIPGTYILDRDGMPVSGRGLRCDHHLSTSATHEVYVKKGDGTWTGDRLF